MALYASGSIAARWSAIVRLTRGVGVVVARRLIRLFIAPGHGHAVSMRALAPGFVLIIGLLSTAVMTGQLRNAIEAKDRERFQNYVDQTQDRIVSRLNTYIAMLQGVAGFVVTADSLHPSSFRHYVNRLQLDTQYPSIQSVGFAERASASKVQELIQSVRRSGFEDFDIWPDYPREDYYPIVLQEPLDERNRAVLGYDMFTDPTRREAMLRACDTGQPAMTSTVTLILPMQENDESAQTGFLIYVPVYHTEDIPPTVEWRRKFLAGFVYSPFRADDMFAQLFAWPYMLPVHFTVYDGPQVDPHNVLHNSSATDPGTAAFENDGDGDYVPRFTATRQIEVNDKLWTIEFATRPEFEFASNRWLVIYVATGGVLLSFVLFLVTRSLAAAQARAQESAAMLRLSDEMLRRHSRTLSVLNRAGLTIAAELQLDRLLQSVTDLTAELIGAEAGVYLTAEPTAHEGNVAATLQVAAVAEITKPELASVAEHPEIQKIVQQALHEHAVVQSKTAWSETLDGDSSFEAHSEADADHNAQPSSARLAAADSPLRSILAVPVLPRSGQTAGVLLLGHSQPQMFTRQHERLARGVAAQAAVAIESANLYGQLQQSEAQYRTLVAQVKDHAIFMVDPRGRIASWNEGVQRVLGFTMDEFVGQPLSRIYTPEDITAGVPALELAEAAETGESSNDRWLQRKDGTRFWASGTTTALRDDSGKLLGFTKVMRDLTDHRRADESLRLSEARFRSMVEQSPLAIVIAAVDGTILSANKAWQDLWQVPSERAIGYNILHDQQLTRLGVMPHIKRAFEGEPVTIPVTRYDPAEDGFPGRARWTESFLYPIKTDQGAVREVVIMTEDVTSTRAAEAALRESQERLQIALSAGHMGVWEWNVATNSLHWSNATNVLDNNVADEFDITLDQYVHTIVHPEDRQAFMDAVTRTVETRADYFAEYRIQRRDTKAIIWVESRGRPFLDAQGNVQRVVGVCMDITSRKEAENELAQHRDHLEELIQQRTRELEQSHQRLRLAERMASIGTLSAGLGHDMGNLLFPIRARLDVMRAGPLPEGFQEHLDAIQQSTDYLQAMTNGLRLLALDPEDLGAAGEATDLKRWWPAVASLFKHALPRGIVLISEIDPDLPPLAVAPHRLTQAMLNLVTNSGDALRPRGSGRVIVWATMAEDTTTTDRPMVRIGVTDDGPGMPPDVQARAMDPFFTTKKRGISTGLGLSLVHGIATSAGGTAEIYSTPGEGTTVYMTLPVATAAPQSESALPNVVISLPDPRQRALVGTMVEMFGWRLLGESNGTPPSEANLWIVDTRHTAPEQVQQFLSQRGTRRVIAFGPTTPKFDQCGVKAVGDLRHPGVLRQKLREALEDHFIDKDKAKQQNHEAS